MQFKSSFPIFDDKNTKIFDSKNNPVKIDIGWDSRCRVSFVISPYSQDGNTGVTRYIFGIQIIELKLSGINAASCGFEETEGYVAEEKIFISEKDRNTAIINNNLAWDDNLK